MVIGNNITLGDIPELWYNFTVVSVLWASLLIGISIFVGWFILEVFGKYTEIKRWAYSLLFLKVPGFTFLVVHVYLFLYSVFNISSEVPPVTVDNQVLVYWYNSAVVMKRWTPVIMCGSWIVGWFIMELFRKSKEVQKGSFKFLIWGTPCFAFVFIYLYCFLYGFFI